jgi:hypothetical protein
VLRSSRKTKRRYVHNLANDVRRDRPHGLMAAAMNRTGILYRSLSLSIGTPLSCHHTLVLRAR